MNKERYIWLKEKHIPVTQEVYQAYYRPEWRERKSRRERKRHEVRYESISQSAYRFHAQSAEVDAIKAIGIQQLYSALNMLTGEEKSLMVDLFSNNLSESKIAKKLGISQMAVNKRKHKIYKKLKKFLSNL